MTLTLAQLAAVLDLPFHGNGKTALSGIRALDSAGAADLSYYLPSHPVSKLQATAAAAVVLAADQAPQCQRPVLLSRNPRADYARAANHLCTSPQPQPGCHASACVAADCQLPASSSIGAMAIIEQDVVIGEHCHIGAACYIGRGCRIGNKVVLAPRVTLLAASQIGDSVTIQSATVIGSDGFGYAVTEEGWQKFPQFGRVCIGARSEIGAAVTIDRGALEDTVIGCDVIIDNQVHIAHNVHIGDGGAIAGCSAIAGSTHIGRRCRIGGCAMINDHLHIADDVTITGATMVTRSLTRSGIYSSGIPQDNNTRWRRNAVRFAQLDDLAKRIRKLETPKE